VYLLPLLDHCLVLCANLARQLLFDLFRSALIENNQKKRQEACGTRWLPQTRAQHTTEQQQQPNPSQTHLAVRVAERLHDGKPVTALLGRARDEPVVPGEVLGEEALAEGKERVDGGSALKEVSGEDLQWGCE
jgi:hypothetical protein